MVVDFNGNLSVGFKYFNGFGRYLANSGFEFVGVMDGERLLLLIWVDLFIYLFLFLFASISGV